MLQKEPLYVVVAQEVYCMYLVMLLQETMYESKPQKETVYRSMLQKGTLCSFYTVLHPFEICSLSHRSPSHILLNFYQASKPSQEYTVSPSPPLHHRENTQWSHKVI